MVCPEDTHQCPDGSTVLRDPANNCQFPGCLQGKPLVCPADVQQCPDGSIIIRDPANSCQFPACPVAESVAANAEKFSALWDVKTVWVALCSGLICGSLGFYAGSKRSL